ncbi:dUTP pyrophosphatase [Melampsora americana]|nr:dUTP pyrophosphatase [Melampsora americana]
MASSVPHTLQVQRLSPNATLPTKGSLQAAGYDLYASADMLIAAGGRAVVPTDLIIAVPPSTYGRVAPRSGLAVKHGINTGAGVIDEDYRGPVGVVLFNHSQEDFQVRKGDRVAQLVIEQILTPAMQSMEQTERGSGGFGSTGGFGASVAK